MTVSRVIMTESSAIADKSLTTPTRPMSTRHIQTDRTSDCDSNLSSVASSSSSTMPALLHHSKRKRLDDVLTKLNLSTCKTLSDAVLNKCSDIGNECDNNLEPNKSAHSDSEGTLTEEQLPALSASYSPNYSQQDKISQKQLSFDSEMSLTVGNLKLNIDDNKKSSQEDKSLLLDRTLSSSSSATAEMLSLVLTGDFSLNVPKTNFEYSSTFREIDSHFNTSSELVPISTTLFTPPTSDSAGGTAEYEEEDEDRAKKDGNDEETDIASVMMHNAKFDNLYGSHEGSKQQLFKKLPQAKLLSHDSAQASHKLSEDVYVPDAKNSPRLHKTLLPTELVQSSSPPFCTTSFFNKIPYFGLSHEALPTFPICKCIQCITLSDQTSSKIPSFGQQHSESRHSLHAWSWHNLKQDSKAIQDQFSYLLPANLRYKLSKTSTSDLSSGNNNTSNLRIEKSCIIGDKKRSHSDSDMIPDYFNLFKSLGAKTERPLELLQQSDPGLIYNKNGRCVPKPLPKTAMFRSEHSTPQDSPLDLSVKSFSPLIVPSSHKYSPDLIAARKKAISNSSSVPSLSTFISPKHVKSTLSQNAISTLTHSIEVSSDDHKTPYKRRNISSSDSLSALSPISSLPSSLAKQVTDGKTLKRLSPLFALYQDENVLSNQPTGNERQSGASSTVTSSLKPCNPKETIASSIKPKKAIKQASDRTIQPRSFNEDKAQSLLSLSDLDTSCFACPICGQTFLLHDRLAKHIASRHKNRQQCDNTSKNYLCDVCDRSFARSDMLTRHMRLHTGIKPYTCKICGQVFSRSDHLSTHQRTHTGEKPYKCPQCPYAACRRDMITRHMRTHSRYEVPDSSSSIDELSKSA